MASISTDSRGNVAIQFMAGDKRRRTLRLGKIGQRTADKIKTHVEDLASAKRMRQSVEPRTAAWVADLDDDELAGRLAAVGLITSRTPAPTATLGAFLDEYVAQRVDTKPATREVWGQVVRNLKAHFGVDRDLAAINEGDADGFKLYLIAEKLASTTVHKRLQFAQMFFRAAMRRKLVASNPFAEVSAKAIMRTDRQHYVTREQTDRLLEVCNPEWRAIVALARYGGLRTPSETLSLRWVDINWDSGRIVVTSPKTAHHEGKGHRVIPLFPELRAVLTEARELAPDGAEFVVSDRRLTAATSSGWRRCNLRTQFERIIKRAGLVPWPRLFHALRGSRETELAKEYPLHVVTSWLGNTAKIAMKHYLMTTDGDFERAAKSGAASAGDGVQRTAIEADESSDLVDSAAEFTTLPSTAQMNIGEDRIRTCGRV